MQIFRFRAGPVTDLCVYYNVWPVAFVVVLHVSHVYYHVVVVFLLYYIPYCLTMQIFRSIAGPAVNFWAQVCPYNNVWLLQLCWAVYCCLHMKWCCMPCLEIWHDCSFMVSVWIAGVYYGIQASKILSVMQQALSVYSYIYHAGSFFTKSLGSRLLTMQNAPMHC